jgi:hypothetical protein
LFPAQWKTRRQSTAPNQHRSYQLPLPRFPVFPHNFFNTNAQLATKSFHRKLRLRTVARLQRILNQPRQVKRNLNRNSCFRTVNEALARQTASLLDKYLFILVSYRKSYDFVPSSEQNFSLVVSLELTDKEVALAVVLAVMGFIFSTRQWILFLSGLTPLEGLVVYYIILYGALYVLSQLGLVVLGIKIKEPLQTFGLLLITFAFFIVVDWESAYVQYVTIGSLEGASPVFLQSEDGAVFWVWEQLLPAAPVETWRILTYVLTPFLLTLIGGLLASEKIKLG